MGNQQSPYGKLQVPVRLFALAKQVAGRETIEIELCETDTVQQLRAAVVQECPALAGLMPQMLVAVDSEYVKNDKVIGNAKEVACIPPVSGG